MASGHPSFDDFLKEFRSRIRQLEEDLHRREGEGDEQSKTDNSALSVLRECQELLLQLTVEAKTAPKACRNDCRHILQACKMQLETYKTLYQKQELFGDQTSDLNRGIYDGSVASQNIRLDEALRSIRETEALAGEIGGELGRNRETLKGAHNKVGELSGMMEQANGHLKSLMRKWF